MLDARHCEDCDDMFIAVTLLLRVPLASNVFCRACLRRFDRPLFWLAAVSADMEILFTSAPWTNLVHLDMLVEVDIL